MPRVISVDRVRLPRWLHNFASRHGECSVTGSAQRVAFRAADDAEAAVVVPFPPLPDIDATSIDTTSIDTTSINATSIDTSRINEPGAAEPVNPRDIAALLLDHVARNRRIGAVLVRRGGFAVGVFDGEELISSKTGSGYVQGRTKAGGWSQQRYARRRANQAQQLYDKASAAVADVLLPVADELVAVVGGGDRSGVLHALEPAVLQPVRDRLQERIYSTEDPRRRVLEAFSTSFLAVEIELNDRA